MPKKIPYKIIDEGVDWGNLPTILAIRECLSDGGVFGEWEIEVKDGDLIRKLKIEMKVTDYERVKD